MHIPDSPVLDQGVVQQAPRSREVQLFERTLAGVLGGRRGFDHEACIAENPRALQEEVLCLRPLAPLHRGSAQLQQRQCFTRAVASGYRERLTTQDERLDGVGTLRAAVL